MIGFTCASNYTLMLAIWLSVDKFKNEKKSIIIYDEIPDCKNIYRKLQESGVFENVKIIFNKNNPKLTNWKRRYHMFVLPKPIKELCRDNDFKKFIFFTNDPLNIPFIIETVYKKNPDCEFSRGEEGIGIYYDEEAYLPTPKIKFWLSIFRRRKYLNMIKALYINEPSLLTYSTNLNIRQINSCADNKKLHDIIDTLWGHESLPNRSFFLMQQPFSEDDKSQSYIDKKANFVFNKICEKFPNLTALKLHPRTRNYDFPQGAFIVDKNLQFEKCLNKFINHKTIVSINSTASFSPFLLWGYTPNIILLYRLFDWGEKQQARFLNFNKFLKKFCLLYAQRGGKIYIPQNEQELFEDLSKIIKCN